MTLNLVKTTYAGLDSTARCVLDLQNKPFFFIRMRNTLYMNNRMKGIRKLTAAIKTMWKYDFMENEEIVAEIDAAYDTISQIAGKEAADQAYEEWSEMAKESRAAMAKAEALEWIATVYEKMTDDDWDKMFADGFSYRFIEDGLRDAFNQLHDDNPDRPDYRNCICNARVAAFVYGYQLGSQRKVVEA